MESRTCYRCLREAEEDEAHCRVCLGPLKTPAQVRRLGWVMLACGAFLLLLMGGITVVVSKILYESARPGVTQRFSGGPVMIWLMYGVFALVLAFGAGAFWSGMYQVRHSRPNRKLLPIMLGIVGLLGVIALVLEILG